MMGRIFEKKVKNFKEALECLEQLKIFPGLWLEEEEKDFAGLAIAATRLAIQEGEYLQLVLAPNHVGLKNREREVDIFDNRYDPKPFFRGWIHLHLSGAEYKVPPEGWDYL